MIPVNKYSLINSNTHPLGSETISERGCTTGSMERCPYSNQIAAQLAPSGTLRT